MSSLPCAAWLPSGWPAGSAGSAPPPCGPPAPRRRRWADPRAPCKLESLVPRRLSLRDPEGFASSLPGCVSASCSLTPAPDAEGWKGSGVKWGLVKLLIKYVVWFCQVIKSYTCYQVKSDAFLLCSLLSDYLEGLVFQLCPPSLFKLCIVLKQGANHGDDVTFSDAHIDEKPHVILK